MKAEELKYDFYENRYYDFTRKIPKIILYVFQQNLDN